VKILVRAIIGEDCVALEDGRKLYHRIVQDIRADRPVELDFAGVQVFAASFFNSSLGFLLRDFESSELNRLIRVSNLAPAGRTVLDRVVKNSRRYYQEMREMKPGNPVLRGVKLGKKEQQKYSIL